MKITFEINGKEELTRQLKGVSDDIADLSDGFREAEKVFKESVQDNYQSENTTGKSGRWQPLSEKYLAQKINKVGFLAFVGLERLSDKTYKSLTGRTDDTVSEINAKDATFGTSVPYAKAQHFGYSKTNLPARPLIDLSASQIKSVGDAIRQTLVTTVKRKRTLVVTEENFNFV